ncbi:hypothetical protein SODALDRAFT_339744 [Sodiomyces alkalinus F11]|uniref:Uncharacterized protein n=1 Tax=Sodiomyces alkalinus (strain CBS 110278 / VKM F-3762 / F11) TaxID=1314773 RepID=A0A3N2PY51_SODAK|nr:hypothetical protein SODALDRAFT_339744 [Sodiomyces alkalinus F11]ROT39414.1 hypothetical protein SODALDRAFT_339744 [Sodiomyces alkalinus F11]
MSVFSSIRKARSHAKEHKKIQTEQEQKEKESHVPYRHVPTHAASDALTNAPPSWRVDDRGKIVEQNRRRSAMAASGMNMRMPGPPPRIASSLSHVSFPAANANPVGNLPRTYSYTGVPPAPGWGDYGSDAVYSSSLKGKDVERPTRFDFGRTSSLSGKAPTRPAHRLHPRSRRTSDASDRGDPAAARAAITTAHDRRPPPSMITRGFNAMPTGATRSIQLPGTLPRAEATSISSAATSPTSSLQSNAPNHQPTFASFDFGSAPSSVTSSAPTSAPISSRSSTFSSAPTTPAAIVITEEPIWESPPLPSPTSDQKENISQKQQEQEQQSPLSAKQKDHRAPKVKVTRFTELETIDSNMEHTPHVGSSLDVTASPASTVLSESAPAKHETLKVASSEPLPTKVAKRLSKHKPGGGKLQKKTRQPLMGSAVAVSRR